MKAMPAKWIIVCLCLSGLMRVGPGNSQEMRMVFSGVRPLGHYGTSNKSAPLAATLRAVETAMTQAGLTIWQKIGNVTIGGTDSLIVEIICAPLAGGATQI